MIIWTVELGRKRRGKAEIRKVESRNQPKQNWKFGKQKFISAFSISVFALRFVDHGHGRTEMRKAESNQIKK
jgi:hypothetical protein